MKTMIVNAMNALLVISIGTALTLFGISKGGEEEQETQNSDDGRYCSATAKALFRACRNEVQDDFFVAQAICINVSDDAERAECFADARASRRESLQLCREQLAGRLDACQSLGEDRYDPDFDPDLFDDDFSNLSNPNPYFPGLFYASLVGSREPDLRLALAQVAQGNREASGEPCH